MSVGGNQTVSFGIKAIADLKGVADTAKALGGLGKNGEDAGKGITAGMASAAKGLDNVKSRAGATAASIKGIAAATAGILTVGATLFKVGSAFDSVTDSIQVATGATGKALDDLSQSAITVFKEVPVTLDEAGQAIAGLAQKTGDTGKALEDLAASELELSHITGSDLATNIDATSKLFIQWGVAAKDQVGVLDELFRAFQSTGVPVADLATQLTQYGPILKSMGFGLDESIALLAGLGKAGVDVGSVITGLRTALAKFAAEGVTDAGAALQKVFNDIKNAKDPVQATQLAIDTFGQRAGPALASNIRSGNLSLDELFGKIKDGKSTIRGTADETADFAEQFTLLKNRITAALIPLGTAFFNAVNQAIPIVSKLADVIGGVASAFSVLPGPVRNAAGGLLVMVAGVAGLAAIGGKLIGIGISTAQAWGSLAGVFRGTAVAQGEAAAATEAVGAAATTAAPEVAALAAAEDGAALSADGMAASEGTAAVASRGFAASLAGLGTALAAVLLPLGALKLGMDELNAAQNGGQPGWSKWANDLAGGLGRIVAEGLKISGQGSLADQLNAYIDDSFAAVSGQQKAIDLGFHIDTSLGVQGGVIKEIGVTIKEAQAEADAAGLSLDDYLKKYAETLGLKKQDLATTYEQEQAAKLKAQADENGLTVEQQKIQNAIDAKNEQDAFNKSVQATLNQQFLASGRFANWMRPFIVGADDAEKAAEQLGKQLDDGNQKTLNFIQGIQDIAPELDGMQTGFGKVGDSVVDIFRKMDDLGAIDLSPAVRGALDAVSALDKVQVKIDDVEKAIQQNQGDMSMWQGRIDLVTNAFGANGQQISEWLGWLEKGQITQDQFNGAINWLAQNGGFPRLDALLAQHKISQKEYNDALSAGTWLLQRSSGALQDEDAEIVKNIISLANYVKAHDDADGAVKKLSETQRGFLAAMDDDKVGAFLNRLNLLYSIHASPEFIKQFIQDAADADATVRAVAQDMGLIPGKKSTVIDADTEAAKKKIKEFETITVDGKKVHIDLETIDAVGKLHEVEGEIHSVTANGATIEVFADTRDVANKFLDLNQNELAQLDGKELKVYVKGDDGNWETIKDHIIRTDLPDKTVKVNAQIGDGTGDPNAPGFGAPTLPGVTIPVTAEDKTADGINAAKTNLDQFATDAGNAGTNAGNNFSTGLATGFQNGVNIAVTAASGIIGAASSVVNGVYNYGFNGGWNFGIGVANGIAATWNAVFNAAFNVGYAAYLGNQAGMQAHSPSKLGLKGGANWGQSVAMGIASTASDVLNAGKALGASLSGVIAAPDLSPAMRAAALSADSRPRGDLLAGDRGGAVSHRVVNMSVTNQFHGITDTGEIIDRVNTQTYQALTRAQAAGAFGG